MLPSLLFACAAPDLPQADALPAPLASPAPPGADLLQRDFNQVVAGDRIYTLHEVPGHHRPPRYCAIEEAPAAGGPKRELARRDGVTCRGLTTHAAQLFLAPSRGGLTAYDLDGTERWHLGIEGPWKPMRVQGAHLYLPAEDGLLAVRTDGTGTPRVVAQEREAFQSFVVTEQHLVWAVYHFKPHRMTLKRRPVDGSGPVEILLESPYSLSPRTRYGALVAHGDDVWFHRHGDTWERVTGGPPP